MKVIAKREAVLLSAAFIYLTRVRLPAWIFSTFPHADEFARYIPFVGTIIGAVGAAVYLAAVQILPADIAITLSMAATIVLTGGFHEDGFADCCDGFGGGWDREKILLIMKDSRVGAFGAIGMVLILLLKFLALRSLPQQLVAAALVSAHSASRALACLLPFLLPYARDPRPDDVKPVLRKQKPWQGAFALVIAILPLVVFRQQILWVGLLLLPLVLVAGARYFRRWIGGYTGDCCGALQQVGEIVFYLSVVAASTWISTASDIPPF